MSNESQTENIPDVLEISKQLELFVRVLFCYKTIQNT